MDPISSQVQTLSPGNTSPSASSFADLGSTDFLGLLITQLRNQDPLEPMGNDELLRQIASVREIELSTTLTDSLKSLTGQQRFGSASSLIGRYVTTKPGDDGSIDAGLVVAVRFAEDGTPILQLAGGREVSLDRVARIQSPVEAANELVGMSVMGVDRRDAADVRVAQGVVTAAREGDRGEVVLELDNGQSLRLRDVDGVASLDA